MNENTKRVLKGFVGLTDSEKALFIRELDKYRSSGFSGKQLFEREVRAFSLGPKNTICDCCGR